MFLIYKRVWQTNWAEQWQYRANLVMYLLYWLVSPVVYLSVWTSVAGRQGSVSGLTANDFVTYYLALLIVDQLTSDITIYYLAYKIRDGTLANELLKPMHPVLVTVLVNNVAFKTLMLIALAPIWGVLCLLFRPDFHAVTGSSVLLAVPAVVLGFGINFLFGATITACGFWTTRVFSLSELYSAVMVLFGGAFVPLDLMPPLVREIAQYLPFQLLKYFPVQLILNRQPPELIARNFALGLVWFGVSLALFLWVWRAGLKRFSAVGA